MTSNATAVSIAALAFAIAGHAWAAQPAPVTAQPTPGDQPSAVATPATSAGQPAATATPEDDGVTLKEVIVTALKRETNLQKTPIAISVLGSDQLADRHALSLISLQDGSIPSLRVATFEARQSALTVGIRGIVPFDANQTARDQGVGVYIDGVYLGRQQGLNTALLDIDRIEVLKGPQGTLFGRNTEGGAVSLVTKGPTGVFGGRVVAGGGNYGQYNFEIHQDFDEYAKTALKIDAIVQHQEPTTRNPATGQAGWNQYDRQGIKASALIRATEQLSALVSVDYTHDENTPFFSQLVNFNPYGKRVRSLAEITAVAAAPAGTINPLASLVRVRTDRQDSSDIGTVQQPSVDETGGASAVLKYKVSPNLELRSITAYRAVATNQWDNSGIESRNVFAPNANFGRYSLSDLYQRQVSQEFQAVGSADVFNSTITYVAGFYYFNEHVKESAATPFTNQWNATGTDFTIRSSNGTNPAAAATAGWERGRRFISRASFADADSYAGYGQATWTPAAFEQLHLTVGGRLTRDERTGTLYTVNNRLTNFPFKFNDTRFDPLVVLAYDVSPLINVYAKYSSGYRTGGANDRSQTFTPFASEEVDAYEIGFKGDFLDRRLRVNVAAWAMDRSNTQIDFDSVDTTPGSPTQGAHTEETRNAPGTSELRGVELDVTARLMRGLTASFAYAYTDTKVPSVPFPFLGNNFIAAGTPFPVNVVYTPENAASFSLDYDRPIGDLTLRAHFDANYADEQDSFQSEFADVSPTGVNFQPVRVRTDSSFIMNANVALADLKFGTSKAVVSFWVRNLADEEHIYRISAANRGTIGDYANFNPPRTYGVEMRIKY